MRPRAKPDSCRGCPAYEWGVGFVPPERPKRHTDLIIVGQGPGDTEARFSQPFHPQAPSGRMLSRWLNEAGFQRTRCLITNVVWCHLPAAKPGGHPRGNREPKPEEITYCRRQHLDPLLYEYRHVPLVVTVGTPATSSLLQIDKVSKYLGTFNWRETLYERHTAAEGGEQSQGDQDRSANPTGC